MYYSLPICRQLSSRFWKADPGNELLGMSFMQISEVLPPIFEIFIVDYIMEHCFAQFLSPKLPPSFLPIPSLEPG